MNVKETCVSINCPFMKNCKSYNFTVERSGGCAVQDELLQAADKLKAQRRKAATKKVPMFKVEYSRIEGPSMHFRSYYLHSLEAAREFVRESYEAAKENMCFPDKKVFPDANIIESVEADEIRVVYKGNSYLWKVVDSKAEQVPLRDLRTATSCIRVAPTLAFHGWSIIFNDETPYAVAPANEFLDAFQRTIIPETGDGWVLHQGMTERKIGYKAYEYKGENAKEVVLAAANKLAVLLDTKVVYKP